MSDRPLGIPVWRSRAHSGDKVNGDENEVTFYEPRPATYAKWQDRPDSYSYIGFHNNTNNPHFCRQ